jgi:dTDP-4-amino-4,6-dideoxygalactose transaminase
MSNVVAAIGIGQLEVLADRVNQKRQIAEWYRQQLEQVDGLVVRRTKPLVEIDLVDEAFVSNAIQIKDRHYSCGSIESDQDTEKYIPIFVSISAVFLFLL